MVGRSSRVAQCSASLPSETRYQWLWRAVKALPVGGRHHAVQRSEVRTFQEDADGHGIPLRDHSFDRHAHVGELRQQPFHGLTRLAWGPFTLPGADCPKGATACST